MEQILSLDSETTGLAKTDRAFSASWKLTGQEAKYCDFRVDDPTEFMNTINETKCRIVPHNASFDYQMLGRAGFTIPLDRLDDTVIRATLINEHEFSYSLDDLASKHLNRRKDSTIYDRLAEKFGGRPTRSAQMGRIALADRNDVADYAIPDAELAHDLWQWQQQEIERQGIQQIVDFERELMPAIIENECRGIRVDVARAERAIEELDKVIAAQEKQLFSIHGKQFNYNSAKDVGTVFKPKQDKEGNWWTEDGKLIPATPGGKPSFSAEALRDIDSHMSRAIVELRSLVKTRDTFLKGHILGHEINGRVYPSIHQTKGEDGGTGTGRFSYSDPALQQIPSRNKAIAAAIKAIFLPEEGHVWVDADMHSFEVRVFAHLVNNPEILALYREDPESDFHQMVADMTGLPRNATYSGEANAKQLNLSMIFNSGNGAIAEKMGMPFTWDSFKKGKEEFKYKKAGEEAMAVIDAYHRRLPGIKELADRAKKIAHHYGYVETEFGRRMRFPNGFKTYKASGLTIQATAADINKKNWLICREVLAGTGGHLLLNTHDSYGFSLPEDKWQDIWKDLKGTIESSFPWFRVPIILELSGHGRNWWEAIE